jgi:hypothetical protein
MADVSKLRRRSTLGSPPSLEEASQNLNAPEIAPAAKPEVVTRLHRAVEAKPTEEATAVDRPPRIDGRSLRKTDRTIPFASRVTPEFDAQLRQIAARDGLKLVEVLEKALALYEAKRKN